MKNDYEVRGDITAVFLKRKDGTIIESAISTSDISKLLNFPVRWYAKWCEETNSFYVYGNSATADGKYKTIKLHRFLLNFPKGLVVDHINNDTLDNTRKNLRVLTRAENMQNRKGAQENNKTGIRGVHWNKRDRKYQANICVNRKRIFLGCFKNVEEAEKAVIEARRKYMPFSKEAMGG